MTKFILHIGLHKTATKYLQNHVFSFLNKKFFTYNPPKLTQLINDLMKAEESDLQYVLNEISIEKNKFSEGEIVLISKEIMAGDLFSFYKTKYTSIKRLNQAFSNAKIICGFRNQLDWIISCYRETIHEHHYQTIQEYLGLKETNNKFVKAKYQDLDFNRYAELLIKSFGKINIHFYFYEDFKFSKTEVLENILRFINSNYDKKILIDLFKNKKSMAIPNRGYSAFAILLSLFRYKIAKFLGLSKLIHRPIFFFGKNSIPAGFEDLSCLPKASYWNKYFYRDNEECRNTNYPDNLSLIEILRFKASWRNIIKNIFDRIIYLDWELLGEDSKVLDNFFKKQNSKLKKTLEMNLPLNYLP